MPEVASNLFTIVDKTALLEIRDNRLYKESHSTFEDYCKERWGLTERRTYQLMDAAKITNNLKNCTNVQLLPTTESQACPLTQLEPEQQREAWQRIVDSGDKVTYSSLEGIKIMANNEPINRNE